MYIICYSEDDNAIEEIPSMPGVHRYGINKLKPHLDLLVKKGLSSILLFGVISTLPKVKFKFVYLFWWLSRLHFRIILAHLRIVIQIQLLEHYLS